MSEQGAASKLVSYAEGSTLVMERTFDAPRELVFKAYSQKEHLENWWGPKGWQTTSVKFDFRPNGEWHYCMKCVDEKQGEFFGQLSCGKTYYQEIVEPERITYKDVFVDAEGNEISNMPEIFASITFLEENDKTKVIIRSQFDSVETLQQIMDMGVVEGSASQYERLDILLEELK
ncbi:SRPBCC domain-containing protein [Ornithinibacillus xuwenensis]|uniref:SRPBCC domain-containing protein n=1 Tax=Ornithinibacillus xuwenensis TaxID=3144668 RepID=A0ABU9XJ72_9BACI